MMPFNKLGRYQLVQKIASGGMADVYRAKFIGVEGFEKDVALKIIRPHWSLNRDFINMLVDEAKIVLHLTHDNIVQVYELNKEENVYFIVMEYVDGVDLRTLAEVFKNKKETFSPQLVCYLTQQICSGLQFAHEKKSKDQTLLGIVHRDISPQNILLSREGQVKVTDFGIARILGKTTKTATGILKGKFSYMSPEQALGQGVDAKTDMFSLGVLMYELVTGKRCFNGSNDLETLELVKRARIVLPQETLDVIPPELAFIILKAVQKDKTKRYSTIADMRADLQILATQLGPFEGNYELKKIIDHFFGATCFERFDSKDDSHEGTQMHPETLRSLRPFAKRKTKILVGGSQHWDQRHDLKDQKTIIEDLKTVLYEKTLLVFNQISKIFKVPVFVRRQGLRQKIHDFRRWSPWFQYGLAGSACLFFGFIVYFFVGGTPDYKHEIAVEQAKADTYSIHLSPQKSTVSEETKDDSNNNTISVTTQQILDQRDDLSFKGSVKIEADPWDSLIKAEYQEKKLTLKNNEMLDVDFEKESLLTILVEKEGYVSEKREVLLTAKSPHYFEKIDLKKVTYGNLRVGARPWGRVYLADILSGVEAPFSNRKIPTGDYTLKVVFPPQKRVVSTTIHVKENTLLKCEAIFGNLSQIYCH